jgi:hypothetical protein
MATNNIILQTYLDAYRDLTAAEPADERSVTISVPLHLAAHHRVEITVTPIGKRRYLLSDGARTIGEVRAAGYSLGSRTKERIERMVGAGMRIVEDHLILETSHAKLGRSIQEFAEASKTIGDIYLVHKQREEAEDDLIADTRKVLDSKGVLYQEGGKLSGQIDSHRFHLMVPANGHPRTAVRVLSGTNTHAVAQIWGFRCDDIRNAQNPDTHVALIYDTRFESWSPTSRTILESRADIALPSDLLGELPGHLR